LESNQNQFTIKGGINMKIAVINEVSASLRNEDIMKALHKTTDAEILNVGMKTPEQMPSLTYIHTSYMAAILLNRLMDGCFPRSMEETVYHFR